MIPVYIVGNIKSSMNTFGLIISFIFSFGVYISGLHSYFSEISLHT